MEDDGGFGASWSAVVIADGFNSRRRHSNRNGHESGTQDMWPSMQTSSRLAHAPMDIDIEGELAKGITGEILSHLHPFQSCCKWSWADFFIIDAGAEESRGGEAPGLEHSFSVGRGKSDGSKLGVLLLWRNTEPCGFNWSRKPGLVDWGPIEDCQRRV